MKIAFQGVPGAYSETAARALFGAKVRTVPCETFEDVFEAVEKKRADHGLIPIENSLAGSIHQNYDLLVKYRLSVVGEAYLRVEHALLALPGTRLKDVRAVRSHWQALAQCAAFFAEHPGIREVPWFDTAGAARSLAEEQPPATAAIAGEGAAKLYGLKVLRRKLQDRAVNYTRFLAIARAPRKPAAKGSFKTSLTFIPKRNEAGVLFHLAGIFAERKLDLSKIESRPDPENPFDYRFYLDVADGAHAPGMKAALKDLAKMARDVRVLGSYPRASLPKTR